MSDATDNALVFETGHCLGHDSGARFKNAIALSMDHPHCGTFFAERREDQIRIYQTSIINDHFHSTFITAFKTPLENFTAASFPDGCHQHCICFQTTEKTLIYSFVLKKTLATFDTDCTNNFSFCAEPTGFWASCCQGTSIKICDWSLAQPSWFEACHSVDVINAVLSPPFAFFLAKNGEHMWITNAPNGLTQATAYSCPCRINLSDNSLSLKPGALKQFLGIWSPTSQSPSPKKDLKQAELCCVSRMHLYDRVLQWASINPDHGYLSKISLRIDDLFSSDHPFKFNSMVLPWPNHMMSLFQNPKSSLTVSTCFGSDLFLAVPQDQFGNNCNFQIAVYSTSSKSKSFKIGQKYIKEAHSIDGKCWFACIDNEGNYKTFKIK